MRWYVPAIIAVVVIALVALLVGRNAVPTSTTATAVTLPPVTPSGRGVGAHVILTKQFFSPTTLTVNQGDALSLWFTSDTDRAISIPAIGAQADLPAGKEVLVTTRPLREGTVTVFCTQGCDAGVNYTITVGGPQ